MSLIIDGTEYNVPISDVTMSSDVLDKYAERNDNGDLVHQVLGVYHTYKMVIGPIDDPVLFQELFDALTAPKNSWTVTHPGGSNVVTSVYYIRVDEVQLIRHTPTYNRYGEMTVKFIPISKSR